MRQNNNISNLLTHTLMTMLFLSSCSINLQEDNHKDDVLWYRQPAQKWEEALPLGNGRLGVMVLAAPQKNEFS